METRFLKDALFSGMTPNAFKLGTVLSLGWFWMRMSGCTVLYRGLSMETVDFDSILVVSEYNSTLVALPDYLEHNIDTTYFYVVHRVNVCGNEEQTLAGAVKIAIDSNGDIVEPHPNSIFEVKAKQIAGSKIELIWFYSPFRQRAEPTCFNVYYDNGTGEIDYQNKLSAINYNGRKFYSYTTGVLVLGKYLFAVRAEDLSGNENASLAQVAVGLSDSDPTPINILSTESI